MFVVRHPCLAIAGAPKRLFGPGPAVFQRFSPAIQNFDPVDLLPRSFSSTPVTLSDYDKEINTPQVSSSSRSVNHGASFKSSKSRAATYSSVAAAVAEETDSEEQDLQDLMKSSSICQYFEGKTVFVTGGTGFVGKVLLETLVKKLPSSVKIYALALPHEAPSQQNQEAKSLGGSKDKKKSSATTVTDYGGRVEWMYGDITDKNWALGKKDLQRLKSETNILFHLAAYTRWDKDLNFQVKNNTLAALQAVDLASQCPNLENMIFTSSYWSCLHLKTTNRIAETVYQDYKGEEELEAILSGKIPERLKDWPNNYSYSKNLAERLIQQRYPHLPITLARLSSVCGSVDFPSRGFCQYNNAIPALMRSVLQGGVRAFPKAVEEAINDSIPVDLCANLLLANCVQNQKGAFNVIHLSSATRNELRLKELLEGSLPIPKGKQEPDEKLVYFSSVADAIEALDSGLVSLKNQDAVDLNKLIVRTYATGLQSKYTFLDYNARRPLQWMNEADKKLLPCDVETVEWSDLVRAMSVFLQKKP